MAVPSLRLESPLALEYVWTNAACVVGTLVECSPGWPGIPQLPLTGQPQRAVQCRRRDADDGYMPRTPSYTNTKCTGRFQALEKLRRDLGRWLQAGSSLVYDARSKGLISTRLAPNGAKICQFLLNGGLETWLPTHLDTTSLGGPRHLAASCSAAAPKPYFCLLFAGALACAKTCLCLSPSWDRRRPKRRSNVQSSEQGIWMCACSKW
ncbi:hypothetical protein CISG_04295 [Coccidioides immitis RMSCC 3703]|uniref:Uncharacterized protein n=1 Tax=Coccidioides immitis RMSCC 3703 TaxID=454286 RepID=A0A0J8QTM0_COCIT|nr:hypothetical protein CISG_04295 [Coccidioides immitis RMSCC 3703]